MARAPRIALLVACSVLAIAGLRAVLAPKSATSVVLRRAAAAEPAADAMAEAFVRAYLTWDASTAHRLAVFGSNVTPPEFSASTRQAVQWTSVSSDELRGRERVVTVAALTDRGAFSVAVTLERSAAGSLAITHDPAIVGAPPIDRGPQPDASPDITDSAVETVVRRAMSNYLAGDRTDLLADLDVGAHVSLPEQPLRVRDADAMSWPIPAHRAAVELRATTRSGAVLALRYELDLVRRGPRWLVRSIQSSPTPGRSS